MVTRTNNNTGNSSNEDIGRKVLQLEPKYFGPLYKYVVDDNITDADYNGTDLWTTDAQGRRTCVKDSGITSNFVDAFSMRVANAVSKSFNKQDNLLEAETETLRISIVHETAAVSGRSICLRKTLPTVRMTAQSMIDDDYCPREIINLLTNCILTNLNFVIGGEPGAGKTEAAKFFSQYVPLEQRVITIEDSPEWHYKKLNPGHDCVEMRVYDGFTYAEAIKTCLRQNPKWIMLSEARSIEAKYLIEAWSTGVHGVTTIHTDSIKKIPSRLLNMMANREDADRLENDIYGYANIVFVVRRKAMPDGTQHRYIEEMGFLYLDENNRKCVTTLMKDGKVVNVDIPEAIMYKLRRAGIDKPFENKIIDGMIGNEFTFDTSTFVAPVISHDAIDKDVDNTESENVKADKPKVETKVEATVSQPVEQPAPVKAVPRPIVKPEPVRAKEAARVVPTPVVKSDVRRPQQQRVIRPMTKTI